MYKPKQFAKLVNKTVKTLQRWDREGTLVAYRTQTNRRYYTHDQYLKCVGENVNKVLGKEDKLNALCLLIEKFIAEVQDLKDKNDHTNKN